MARSLAAARFMFVRNVFIIWSVQNRQEIHSTHGWRLVKPFLLVSPGGAQTTSVDWVAVWRAKLYQESRILQQTTHNIIVGWRKKTYSAKSDLPISTQPGNGRKGRKGFENSQRIQNSYTTTSTIRLTWNCFGKSNVTYLSQPTQAYFSRLPVAFVRFHVATV